MHKHDFEPPANVDYRNVTEFNLAWLREASKLKGPQRARLASAPFLLFSMHEDDLDWWHAVLGDTPQSDWLRQRPIASAAMRSVQCAALGFLWQLAWRNPYAVRLISGAGVAWCDLLRQVPLVTLVDRVGARADLCKSRIDLGASSLFGMDCVSSVETQRRASHLVALQSILTSVGADADRRLPAAACKMPRPLHRVADQTRE